MNNADSFAMAFDEIWKKSISQLHGSEIDQEKKLTMALEKIQDHPFIMSNPSKAREVAQFRIRLLNLQ